MENKKIMAMAIAAVAEENGIEIKRVLVRSFSEIKKSSLESFIEDNKIAYHKYTLEDERS